MFSTYTVSVLPEQGSEYSNVCFGRTSSPEATNTNYTTCNTLPNISNSHPHQYQSGSVGHTRYDTSPYPTSVTGSSNPAYWSGSYTNNSQPPQANNFHQNCYPNYYGVNVPSGPITPAPVQNNPYLNPVPPPPPPPTMVLYPHLYSTVNQNQIHLHLHHSDLNKPVEQYADDVATVVGNSNLTITGGSRSIEIGIVPTPNQTPVEEQNDIVITRYNDRQNNDLSVWRPY